jgi:hypothetical protein
MRAPWFQSALMKNIRRFQGLLEAAFLADLPEIATALGMSEEQLLKSTNLAHETGLGFVCLRPFDGVQPGTEAGQRCSYLDRCHLGCPVRRFVPNETSVLALLLTNRSLRAAEQTWIAENPQRWERTWIVLLAETEAYITRLRESSFRLVLRQAEEALEASLASGALELVEVW